MSDMTVANTILEQLGGGKFRVMTGAKNFTGDDNSLTFHLPSNFATKGINIVKVILDATDTYTVEFSKLRAMKLTAIASRDDVYCFDLQRVFTEVTGL
jgi:hypothetical protein